MPSTRLQAVSCITRRLLVPSTARTAPSITFCQRLYASDAKQPSNMSPVTDIKSMTQFKSFINDNPYVALQAHATWCGPCKAISPIFEKHADALARPDTLAFARFDTDDVPDLAHELNIRSIPAFFFFEKGEKTNNVAGAAPPALEKAVKELAAKADSSATTS
ncbi:hypothetical protein CDD82_4590 [Ophiocordyceps australis]|uniref:Thioredoxin domain-containing protein n=1 Tax=Ophiocordyceps australis TaxID=1399860 RepID=A0A2C5Z5I6_9HYPO|nr:hypothetical protein CDD82_4590 [Ophiocordyceps australis]